MLQVPVDCGLYNPTFSLTLLQPDIKGTRHNYATRRLLQSSEGRKYQHEWDDSIIKCYIDLVMAVSSLTRALRTLSLSQSPQVMGQAVHRTHTIFMTQSPVTVLGTSPLCRGFLTTATLDQNRRDWKETQNAGKYTIRPMGLKKTGGRDHSGRIRTQGIGGGHKQLFRWVDIHRFPLEPEKDKPVFDEKVVEVRYDPCRTADIALVAGGEKKRWIIATEKMQVGDIIKTSSVIGRMAVSANEGDSHPLGALAVGTLVNCLEIYPGKGAKYIRAAGTCGVLLRKVNGTAIVQLPSKRQVQVLETCMATVGRVSNIDHNMRVIGKAGRNRWLGIRPSSGLWQRKGGWAGRKIKPLPPMKNYINLPSFAARK